MLLVDERHGTEQEEEFGSAGHPAGQEGQTLTQAFQPRLCGELHCPKTLSINTQHVSWHLKNHWKLHRALENTVDLVENVEKGNEEMQNGC